MDLRTFITETLVQIAQGVSNANEQLGEAGAIANPANVTPSVQAGSPIYGVIASSGNVMRRVVQSVNFDVAIVATEGSGKKGGIGVVVGAIALGSQGSTTTNNSSHSRVQFSVPMALPEGKV